MKPNVISLAHGSGGRFTHELIRELMVKKLGNPILNVLGDSALIPGSSRMALTTDSFVVSPWKFPGANIGTLAVCGTINDLAMAGAQPQFLSLACIMEEGLPYRILEEVIDSIAAQARKAKVRIVTGDSKVVERGSCDKLFITTSGVGTMVTAVPLSLKRVKAHDKVVINGCIGEHGLAVLSARKILGLAHSIRSDCAALHEMVLPLLAKGHAIKFMRDPTRGGLASTMNEIAEATGLGIMLDERKIPLSKNVKVACELLGLDPLYIANEGKVVIIVEAHAALSVVNALRKHPLGKHAQIIGEVVEKPKAQVVLTTLVGTRRIVDMPVDDPLPRIC
ncbi:MAG: hydrogenase expression/formation protein HypE [Candidatus Omnitrophica bacterium]|nr:hydrogenase expression/formation protein HypE [Candidatus Omnitrophota bacterium]